MRARVVLILVLISFAPIFVTAKNKPATPNNRENTQQTNPPTPVSVNCNCTSKTNEGKDKPQGWHKFITWPEGIVTWAIILTLGAIAWQAIETRRAAQAALRSVKLQEAQLGQWLEIVEVEIQCPEVASTTTEVDLIITFRINNPTKMVVTLTKVSTKLFNDDETVHSQTLEYTLAPNNTFPQKRIVGLTESALKTYAKDRYVIPVSVHAEFRDVFGNPQSFSFAFQGECRQGGFQLFLDDRDENTEKAN